MATESRKPLTVKEAAETLGVSESFLNKKRVQGGGPKYIKIGQRVVYEETDLEAYKARCKRTSTSHEAA